MFDHSYYQEIERPRIDKMIAFMGDHLNDIHTTEHVIDDLKNKGFFIKPASLKYHGAYDGALFDHSLEVTKALVEMTEKLDLKWSKKRSLFIVGMLHDLCKTELYVFSEEKNCWIYNPNRIKGHGDRSAVIAQDLINLTKEEILCIRWHMGAFDEKENWNAYGEACTLFPNVLYTHTADMIASRIKGV